jgi:hypothetical protein
MKRAMDELTTRRTQRDIRSLASLGVLLGGLAGMIWEIGEIYIADFNDPKNNELEPFGTMFFDIVSFALGGAVLFAAISAIRNRIRRR